MKRTNKISLLLIGFTFVLTSPVFAQDKSKPAKPATAKPAKPAAATPAKPAAATPAKPAAATPAKPAANIGTPITAGTEKKRDVVPSPSKVVKPKVSSNVLKLRQLAELVEDLKNKVIATKYRLQLLKEAMTGEKDSIGGAKIVIHHLNKMGGAFRMVKLRYFMDGKLIQSYSAISKKDKETLSKKKIVIPVGHITPGNVRIRVFITYQGNGYGAFNYVKKWRWEVHNSYSFNVIAGKYYTLEVIGKEKGGWTTPLGERPQIKFNLKSKALVVNTKAKTKSKSKGSSK